MIVAIKWAMGALLVAAFAIFLTVLSPAFGYAYDVDEMPILWLVGILVLSGLIYFLCLPRLVADSLASNAKETRLILAGIFAAGLAARLILFASEPMLEDDYQRYLFDGAVTANGFNPYSASPRGALAQRGDLGQIALEGGQVVRRINHPDLRTVYPPVAQAAFALAYLIEPWSLPAWRFVILLFDLATLALILLLLRDVGRSPLWAALYWWNPVVLKELFNSAHMEAVVLPFVLFALWMAMRSRLMASALALAIAAGAKIWPALLLPSVLRGRFFDARQVICASVLFAAVLAFWAIPIWLGGLDQQSGFMAYLSSWQTNSALFPALERAAATILPAGTAGPIARGVVAIGLAAIAVFVSLKPIETQDELMGRASLVVAALLLLSPAQFPWYAVWFAPFLCLRPWTGFLLLTATIPLYYAGFYFVGRDQLEAFGNVIVWIIWLPVWTALAFDAARTLRRPVAA